jgi:hypothetical protein
MTLEIGKLHSKYVELKTRSTTSIIIIGITMAAVIVGISVIPALTLSPAYEYTNLPPSKQGLCMSKVLGLAQKGIIRDVGGYDGALSECMAMKSADSIYGDAGAA